MEEGPLAEGKKNARRRGAWIVFIDESGISLTPPLRRTWAPRGKTPILRHHFNWKSASMASALCFHPDHPKAKLLFEIRPGAYNQDAVIRFLTQLRRHLRGKKATVLWDGLTSHRSRKTTAFIVSQRHWLVVERLPGYAPELNPCEWLWGNLKGQELAHLSSDTLADPMTAARAGIKRIRGDRALPFGFLRAAGLSL